MNKTLHGAILGLLVGGPAVFVSYAVVDNAVSVGTWTIWAWIVGWVAWGAILGTVLPKHK